MVDYTQLRHLLNNTIHTKAALTDETKAAFVKYKEAFLNQLKIGDLIEGKLIKGLDSGTVLQLKEGIEIPVKFEGQLIGSKLMTFIVQDLFEGVIHLKPYEEASLQDKAMETLKLPQNLEMKACIDAFVSNELPLDKEMLLKSYVLHKQIKIPYEVITNVIEKLGEEAKSFLLALQSYRPKELLEGIEKFKTIMMNQGEMQKSEWLSNQVKWLETLVASSSKEQIQVIWKEIEGELPKELLTLSEEEKQGFMEILKESKVDPKAWLVWKSSLLEHPEKLLELNSKLYDQLFTFSKKQLKNMMQNKISPKEIPLFEGYEKLFKCLKSTEEMTLPKELREWVGEIQENLTQGYKLQTQGQYFVYPMEIEKQKEEATVYFYKPKKKGDKNKRDYFAVVALDMPALDKIEVHIHQIDKELSLDFLVQEKAVSRCIEANFGMLQEKLIALGYKINRWQCQLKKDSDHKGIVNSKTERTSLDLRV